MTTIVAVKSGEGVALASDRRASKGFFVGSKDVQKIYPLDDSISVAMSGLMSDAEYVIKLAKAERKLIGLRRNFPLSVKETAKLISNIAYSGMRSYQPFFADLLVAGVDPQGAHIYAADISGSLTTENFASSGSGSPLAYGVLEGGYKEGISLDEAKQLAEKAVRAAMERDPGSGNGVVTVTISLNGSATVSKEAN
ncbi:MAG: proteasome subunit beta [Thaumarchaeota archaeon]|nr:proteasome subunit beta [Nitrososphaerota archaeon]